MKSIMLKCLIIVALITGFAAIGTTGETKKIYDKDWKLKGYIQDDGQGTKKIYDKDWKTEGYIKDDRIYDKNWNRKGTIEDSGRKP
ncbi:MAG: hypothetical protein ACYDHW_10675 [Syntrophorhabdaceae bacterium]